MTIRLGIVDPRRLFVDALEDSLNGETDLHVVATATSTEEFEALNLQGEVDLVILHWYRSGSTGIRHLVGLGFQVIVLMDEPNAANLRETIRAGASGLMITNTRLEHLVFSLRSVLGGQLSVPREQSGVLMDGSPHQRRLSPREQEVLRFLVRGATSTQIAQELEITPNTVRTLIQRILKKLNVHSRLEAAAIAIREEIH